MQPDLSSINSNPLVYLRSTVWYKLHSYPPHLFNMSQHSQGFRVKVVLDDNWCRCLAKQYNKGWGNKRRRGCVSPVVFLTILSHALIAQSPSLASAGAQRLSHVVRAPWLHRAGCGQILPRGLSQRGIPGVWWVSNWWKARKRHNFLKKNTN